MNRTKQTTNNKQIKRRTGSEIANQGEMACNKNKELKHSIETKLIWAKTDKTKSNESIIKKEVKKKTKQKQNKNKNKNKNNETKTRTKTETKAK